MKHKLVLRIVGIILLILGVSASIFAFVDFFKAFNSHNELPQYNWVFFISFPVTFLGGALLLFSLVGKAEAYQRRIVKTYINDFKNDQIICPYCEEANPKDSEFCKNCGKPLKKICKHCLEENPSDAKFCKHCGKELE